jgi:hypothetical protein
MAGIVTDLDPAARKIFGGIMKTVLHAELRATIAQLLPALVDQAVAARVTAVRHGKTAGQIWKQYGFPPIKITSWFGNKLAAFGCQIDGYGRGELGLMRARLFDPDKADHWLKNGGELLIRQKIAERQGQGVLRLVQSL